MTEDNWPEGIKKSRELLNLDYRDIGHNFTAGESYPMDLGDIIVEGPRPHICAWCGQEFGSTACTMTHHIKPETYAFRYKGLTFYLELHLCDKCLKEARKRKLL